MYAPRLLDDPAWVRYEHELRFLALYAMRASIASIEREMGIALLPATRAMALAFERYVQTVRRLNEVRA